jgi:3-oxoacyl-[acyl-carrier protein] reductase
MMHRVVLVTGGSRGIGKAIAAAFASEGDAVIINYHQSANQAEAIRIELSTVSKAVAIEQADVSDFHQVRKMVQNSIERYGQIDVLVNNAGLAKDGFIMLMSERDWRDVIDVNLSGVFNCTKAVTEHMISRRRGVIINVASLSGITGLPGQVNYAAAKGGVIAFTKALSKELAPFGIRVNAVAPGIIETDMTASLNDRARERFLQAIPMRRFGTPLEVASVVKFLASDDASYITGETICITGGLP